MRIYNTLYTIEVEVKSFSSKLGPPLIEVPLVRPKSLTKEGGGPFFDGKYFYRKAINFFSPKPSTYPPGVPTILTHHHARIHRTLVSNVTCAIWKENNLPTRIITFQC